MIFYYPQRGRRKTALGVGKGRGTILYALGLGKELLDLNNKLLGSHSHTHSEDWRYNTLLQFSSGLETEGKLA